MSEVDNDEASAEEADSASMRALMRRAFSSTGEGGQGRPAGPEVTPPAILKGVQRKIRRRSRGKFFTDGWSTGSGRIHYPLVATIMLLLVLLTFFALGPVGVSAP